MELSALKYFLNVAESGSISSAANALNTVQSNVTARIKKLEEEIGSPLFIRQSRGMKLTTQGEVLLGYAQKMIDLEREAFKAVGSSVEDGGSISLGSMETAMAQRLPPILKTFNRLHPLTQLTVQTGTTQDMIESVLNYKLDCAIVGNRVEHPDIERYPFFTEKLVIAHSSNPDETRTLLVYREGCAYRARAEEWLRRSGKLPYKIMEFGTQEGIIGCVGAGLGMTLMPEIVAKNFPQDVKISPLEEDLAYVDTYFICRKNTNQSKPMSSLINLIEENQTHKVA